MNHYFLQDLFSTIFRHVLTISQNLKALKTFFHLTEISKIIELASLCSTIRKEIHRQNTNYTSESDKALL